MITSPWYTGFVFARDMAIASLPWPTPNARSSGRRSRSAPIGCYASRWWHFTRHAALRSVRAPVGRDRRARPSRCASSSRRRPHLQRPPPHRAGSRSAPERDERAPRPNQRDTSLASSPSPAPTPKRPQRLRPKLIRCDDEDRIWGGVGHVDHAQIPPHPGPTQRNPRPLSSWSILHGPPKYVFDFLLCHSVPVDVRLFRLRIDVAM